jgi:predicted transcriptional regulator
MFSPRAIMRREPKVEADTPAPRRERPRIAARAMPAAPAPAATPTVSGVDHDLAEEAVRLIIARSAELEAEVDPEAKVPVDLILDHARETGELLSAVVSRGQSSEMRRINNDLGGVMDTIMLMQLEKGHAPADDALTLLLQLKRELETLRAL